MGGSERESCPGFRLQGVEEFPGRGVTVQEGQDFAVDQLAAAVAAQRGQDAFAGPQGADGLLTAALQRDQSLAGETTSRLGRH